MKKIHLVDEERRLVVRIEEETKHLPTVFGTIPQIIDEFNKASPFTRILLCALVLVMTWILADSDISLLKFHE